MADFSSDYQKSVEVSAAHARVAAFKASLKKEKKRVKLLYKEALDIDVTESIDLENGTGKVSGTFDHEPKSASEIISLLKIDTTKWKLSQYWNKQMGDHWRVSALISQIKNPEQKFFENLLENWIPKKYKISN